MCNNNNSCVWLILIIILVLLGVAGVGVGTYRWSQTKYYIGDNNGKVAIFQGVPTSIFGAKLSHAVTDTNMKTSDLPPSWREQLDQGISFDTYGEAKSHTRLIKKQLNDAKRKQEARQQEKAEAEKDTATRMFEIRIDEPDDYVHRGLGRMQFVADALLYVTVKPKATCNGKDDGQQRYGRKQRPVRQGRSHAVEPFTFETTHCQHNAFHRSASQLSGTARAGGITPKSVTQEAQRAHNLSGDPFGQFHRHFLLFFFSRHRGGISDGEEAEQWEKDTKGGDVNELGRSTSLLLQAKLSNSTQNGIIPPTKMPHSPFAPHTSRLSAPE